MFSTTGQGFCYHIVDKLTSINAQFFLSLNLSSKRHPAEIDSKKMIPPLNND